MSEVVKKFNEQIVFEEIKPQAINE